MGDKISFFVESSFNRLFVEIFPFSLGQCDREPGSNIGHMSKDTLGDR